MMQWKIQWDEFWRSHPRLMLVVTCVLAIVAAIVVLDHAEGRNEILYQGF